MLLGGRLQRELFFALLSATLREEFGFQLTQDKKL